MMYPEAINLPFNGVIIKEGFRPLRPGAEAPPEPGYWVILRGSALVLEQEGDEFRLLEGERPAWLEQGTREICFGAWHGEPLRAMMIHREVGLPAGLIAEPLNARRRRDYRILTLGGLAYQILQWNRQSGVCSICGGGLEPIPATWGKRCIGCGHEHFPHIHPCVIVLVRKNGEFLLARKGAWPKGFYSLLAGFLDFGESLEECVHREVLEETGIHVRNVRYVGSQNWPFPSQLMTGFVADYAGGEITPDREELEDARWFSAASLPESLPGRLSIARWIIDTFALDDDGRQG
jgi:NAD+ diphosphatase